MIFFTIVAHCAIVYSVEHITPDEESYQVGRGRKREEEGGRGWVERVGGGWY